MGKTKSKRSPIKKILKRDLVSNRKYKTTYKDINRYFKLINKEVFKNVLAPFNDIKIKKIYKDETKKFCYGQEDARNHLHYSELSSRILLADMKTIKY